LAAFDWFVWLFLKAKGESNKQANLKKSKVLELLGTLFWPMKISMNRLLKAI